MDNILGELDASMQAKVEADTDFQATIATLSDDEKKEKIDERKSELLNKEIATLREGSERATKAEELASNYKIRAEKAEGKTKDTSGQTGSLDQKDVIYLAKADIDAEDLDEVTSYAALKKIPVSEAHTFLKPILDQRTEERRTAAATHVRGSGRGSAEVSGEDLLAKAERGEEVPLEDGNEKKIFQARLQRKTSKFRNRK